MDVKMEDVGKSPEPQETAIASEPPSIGTLDGWIDSLMSCKQLSEADVQRLCNKVPTLFPALVARVCWHVMRELR